MTGLDLLPPVAGSPKNLPNEVLLIIFTPLEKSHLKPIRCVCRLFSRLVSPLLFDQIHVSPHRINLDVFRQIAEHPDLCQYPRLLIYDVQEFQAHIDPQMYYKELCHQLSAFLCPYPKATIQHPDKELEGLLHMLKSGAKHNLSEYKKYSTCRIVQRGFELYSEKAKEQDCYNRGDLFACLCIGLMRLPRVDKVNYQARWIGRLLHSIDWSKNLRYLRSASSPLARSWSPFHLKPVSSKLNPTHVFDNVIRAFSLTGKPLRVLESCCPSVSYEVFNSNSLLSRTFGQHSFPALHCLETLRLDIKMSHYLQSSLEEFDDGPDEKTLSVDLLAATLRHMPGLKNLRLTANTSASGNGLISMSELFQTFPLPALEALDLEGMLGSAAHISTFLRAQPRLRILSLEAIELSEGTWVGLVDDMQRWLVLDSLYLQLPLREDGGVNISDDHSWSGFNILERIEEYVLNGGENPLRVPE